MLGPDITECHFHVQATELSIVFPILHRGASNRGRERVGVMCLYMLSLCFFRIYLDIGKHIENPRCVHEVYISTNLKTATWKKERNILCHLYP